MSLAKEVWDTLSKVDVSDHVEKKQNLTYLSWAWAWGVMMEHYPDTEYRFEDRVLSDGTMEVTAYVTITHCEKQVHRYMWLPVMDYKNKAVPNPDAFALNTAKMRCLTKCFAMFGLGHYIYAGEDVPQGQAISVVDADQVKVIEDFIVETQSDFEGFKKAYKIKEIAELTIPSYEKAIKQFEAKRAKANASL